MVSTGKTLRSIADEVGARISPGDGGVVVDSITHDSRAVTDGSLFVALKGESFDGHRFVHQARDAGAAAVCVSEPTEVSPNLTVKDTREVLGALASTIFDHPSTRLKVVGVTGTNGKTTVTHYLDSMWRRTGVRSGLIGTVQTRVGDSVVDSVRTTPEASEFQALLAGMVAGEITHAAVEVSSHALELGRVNATRFEVAAFTSFSQDHLDFHGDMTAYGEAKLKLFAEHDVGTAVVNIGDPFGEVILERANCPVLTVGPGGDIQYQIRQRDGAGTRFDIDSPWGGGSNWFAPIVADFNLTNLVVAAGCFAESGGDFGAVESSAAQLDPVPGRFETVSSDDPIKVIVDYAHTPDGIVKAIAAARLATGGRVIAVAGAGGDRDQGKRPMMGRALSDADVTIVTSDNPRSEDPFEIMNDVAQGLSSVASLVVDRGEAIERAINEAAEGDTVLILGRGHEPLQDLGDSKVAFDDRAAARKALHGRRSREGREKQ